MSKVRFPETSSNAIEVACYDGRVSIMDAETKAWFDTRPRNVQELFKEFPIGLEVMDKTGFQAFVVGYSEPSEIALSFLNPYDDFGAAKDSYFLVPAVLLRGTMH